MPARPPKKPSSKVPTDQAKVRSKAEATRKNQKDPGIAASGLTSRVKGHVSARGKRVQAKRDGN